MNVRPGPLQTTSEHSLDVVPGGGHSTDANRLPVTRASPPETTPYKGNPTDAKWHGLNLMHGERVIASLIRDRDFPHLYRVKLPDGFVSDMVNLTRAKEAARLLARVS
jgi:hypothetical protein